MKHNKKSEVKYRKDFIAKRENIQEPILKIIHRRRENTSFRNMSKLNQKIVLFIEPAAVEFYKPSKIGNLLINRFAIDEDAKNEILKIYQLDKQFYGLYNGELTLEEGLDLIENYL